MGTIDLPPYPARGNRRKLDQQWLAKLQREGAEALLLSALTPPPALERAVDQFNQQQFWECHETLELLWLPEGYPLRLFYHGLIKAAVGLYHLQGHNRRGAASKLRDAVSTLAPFTPQFMGLQVSQLRLDISERLAYFRDGRSLDWEGIDKLPPVLIHRC